MSPSPSPSPSPQSLSLLLLLLLLLGLAAGSPAPRPAPPRPADHGDGLSNLQMLIPLLVEDSQHSPRAPRLSDGPYSDIPAEAFRIEPAGSSETHTSAVKKDLGQFRAAAPPAPLVAGCVHYFQGRARPPPRSAEALLQLCTELLADASVEDVLLAPEEEEEPCAPPPAEGGGLGALLQALVQLLQSAGSRRRWLIMNTNHPDPLMRQYVDVEM